MYQMSQAEQKISRLFSIKIIESCPGPVILSAGQKTRAIFGLNSKLADYRVLTD